jgi:DNA-binding NarL/FixJ family response regulator
MKIALITSYEIVKTGLSGMIAHEFKEARIITMNSLSELEDAPSADFDIIILGSSNLEETDLDKARLSLLKERYPSLEFILLDELNDKRSLQTLTSFLPVMQGFITLECDSVTLAGCLSAVSAGKKYLSQELAQLILENFQEKKVPPSTKQINLTKKEFEVANMLVNGVKVSDVAKLTGRKISTISTIKKNIFRKTNVENLFNLKDMLQN